MGPGAIAFTLMPLSMRCVAKPFVKVVMAPCTDSTMIHQSSISCDESQMLGCFGLV